MKFGESTSNEYGGWGGPKNISIGGDLVMYETGSTQFNVSLKGRVADYSNPDIYIGGVINFAGDGSHNPNLTVINRTSKYTDSNKVVHLTAPVQVVISSNGLTGNGVISNNSSATDGASKAFLHLRNTGTQTFNGWIQNGTNCTTKIVMNGTGKQILTSANNSSANPTWGLVFTGGVEVISGTLEMNFANQTNHGNLEMKGGVFQNYTIAGAKNVNFTKLIYDGGTLVSRWNGSALDIFSFSEGVFKGTAFNEDSMLIISLAGDLSSMLNKEQKIFSWDNTTYATDFTESDFKLSQGLGSFSIKDDGLYVTLTSVPEPSTVAAIFGAIALAFAFYRRR